METRKRGEHTRGEMDMCGLTIGCVLALLAGACEESGAGDITRREYPLGDILKAPPRLDLGAWPNGGDPWGGRAGPGMGTGTWLDELAGGAEPELPGSHPPHGPRGTLHAATVAQWVAAHVTPEVWPPVPERVDASSDDNVFHREDAAGYAVSGNPVDQTLEVRHRPEGHREVERLLDALRVWRKRRFRVEVAALPTTALGSPAPRVGEPLAPGVFDAMLARAGPEARYGSFLLRDGQSTRRFAGKVRAVLEDYEVNQTGVFPVTLPVVLPRGLGQGFDLSVRAVAPGPLLAMELAASRVREAEGSEKRGTPYGDLERTALRRDAIQTSFLLRAGSAVVVAVVHEAVGGGDASSDLAWIVRVREDPASLSRSTSSSESRARVVPRVYDGGWLLWPSAKAPISGGLREHLLAEATSVLEGAADAGGDPSPPPRITLGDDMMLVTATPEAHRRLEAWLLDRARRRADNLRMRVDLLEGPRGSVPAPESRGESSDEVRVAGFVEALGLPGSHVTIHAYTTRPRTSDCQWLSGGCTGPGFAAPDPVVVNSLDGLFAVIRAEKTLVPKRMHLELCVQSSQSSSSSPAKLLVPSDLQRPPGAGRAPSAAGSRENVKDVRLGITRLLFPWDIDRTGFDEGIVQGRYAVEAGEPLVLRRWTVDAERGRAVVASVTRRLALAGGEQ